MRAYILQGLAGSIFGHNIKERTAGCKTTNLSATTMPTVGYSVAKPFELSVATFQSYGNSFLYIHLFHFSQIDMRNELTKASGSGEKDWSITKVSVNETITLEEQRYLKRDNYN